MMNWLVRHIDAINDRIQEKRHTEKYADFVYIIEVLGYLIKKGLRGILYILTGALLFIIVWCLYIVLYCWIN